jgi:hypothetical protein
MMIHNSALVLPQHQQQHTADGAVHDVQCCSAAGVQCCSAACHFMQVVVADGVLQQAPGQQQLEMAAA